MAFVGKSDLIRAVDLALSGEWESAHKIVQQDDADPIACWIHAVVHKVEGDEANSRYWYRRTNRNYEDYEDVKTELVAIEAALKE